MYNNRTLDIIRAHNASKPLFLYNAWQEAHTPNEVRVRARVMVMVRVRVRVRADTGDTGLVTVRGQG